MISVFYLATMFGRSLISLLAVSVLAVQTIAANRYHGRFSIQHKNGGYIDPDAIELGSLVRIDTGKDVDDYMNWFFMAFSNNVVAVRYMPPTCCDNFYLAPVEGGPGNLIGLRLPFFEWKVRPNRNGTVTLSSDGLFLSRGLNDSIVLLPKKKAVGDAPLWQLIPFPMP
ncbi:hypothetical protein B0O80DRAFT_437250 [Mortierella sp. GBAus27b]|nr:hypothetical protein B0O80DRAFT_437250 [Mortierella sp. GBAus27b]